MENKSSLYKWMGRSEPFELDLICLVTFKRRDPPELVRGLSEVHWQHQMLNRLVVFVCHFLCVHPVPPVSGNWF